MNQTTDVTSTRTKHFGVTSILFLVLAGCLVLAVIPLRRGAADFDFAIVNMLTSALCLVSWILATLGFWIAGVARWKWRTLLVVPVLCIASFLLLYRLDRFDGDLAPHFVSRWQAPTVLPTQTQRPEATDTQETTQHPWMQPRATDSLQFLGTDRTGVYPDVHINPDWKTTPPTIAWKHAVGNGWSSFAVQGDLGITMEQREQEEWVTAYDIRTGQLVWKHAISAKHHQVLGGTGPRTTPTIQDNRVYASSAVDAVVCLDMATGSLIWSTSLLDGPQADFEHSVAWGRSGSPLVHDGKVYVPLGGVSKTPNALIALDAATGKELFRAGSDQISYSSPTLMTLQGVEQLVYTSETKLAGYDLDDGQTLWECDAPGKSSTAANVAQPIALGNDRILLTKGYGLGSKLYQITRSDTGQWTSTLTWENTSVLKTKFTTAVVKDGFAYALSDGILECIDIENGKRQWKRGRYRQGQVLLAGDHLLVTSEAGEAILLATDPSKHRELGKLQVVGDVNWNTAAISGNRLLMRNSDEMACVILPLQGTNTNTPADTKDAQ